MLSILSKIGPAQGFCFFPASLVLFWKHAGLLSIRRLSMYSETPPKHKNSVLVRRDRVIDKEVPLVASNLFFSKPIGNRGLVRVVN